MVRLIRVRQRFQGFVYSWDQWSHLTNQSNAHLNNTTLGIHCYFQPLVTELFYDRGYRGNQDLRDRLDPRETRWVLRKTAVLKTNGYLLFVRSFMCIVLCGSVFCVRVCSQGFTGKSGMEGPQGPVGMYVSDSSAPHLLEYYVKLTNWSILLRCSLEYTHNYRFGFISYSFCIFMFTHTHTHILNALFFLLENNISL